MRTLLHMWNITPRQPGWLEPRPEAVMDGQTQANQHVIALPGHHHSFGEWAYTPWEERVGEESKEILKKGAHGENSPIRAHLHQRRAGPPAGAGSVFRAGRVFTLARVRAQFHFTRAPFCGTGSLICKYRPISAPHSCGSRRRIAPWAISAGARRGPAAETERAHGGVNSTIQFLQTNPLRNPREPLYSNHPRAHTVILGRLTTQ